MVKKKGSGAKMSEEKLQRQLRRAGAEWKDEDLDEILALLDKDYTDPGQQARELPEPPALPQPEKPRQADKEKPRKEKKEKPAREAKEAKPLTAQQRSLRTAATVAGLTAAILAELTVLGFLVSQWVQWL